jgi:hypothetical protein
MHCWLKLKKHTWKTHSSRMYFDKVKIEVFKEECQICYKCNSIRTKLTNLKKLVNN